MQYLDDDMDEMFRKAAENYPVKTDSANWDAVQKSLQEQNNSDIVADKKNNKYRRLLWLLLLLPLPFICTKYFNNGTKETAAKVTPKQAEITKKNNSKETNTAAQNKEAATKPALDKTIASGKKTYPQNKENTSGFTAKQEAIVYNHNNSVIQNNNSVSNDNSFIPQQPAIDLPTTTQVQEPVKITSVKPTDINKQLTTKQGDDTSVIASIPIANDTTVIILNDTSKAKINKKSKLQMPVKKRFYAGIISGIDVSTIKFQSIKKPGYSLGLLIGYRFNKNISVETGLLWNKKNYYTEGKYFNKQRTNIPYNVWIKEMDGNCGMYELPVNFRYDVLQHTNNRLFATAGFSTYFMKKEDYNYTAQANGNWYSGSRSYKNSTNNWFGILNLTAGYEVRISNIGNFRVEPYLKVPLKGLGIGSMPILSGGLNIGITRTLK